jgi:hypothetical protein
MLFAQQINIISIRIPETDVTRTISSPFGLLNGRDSSVGIATRHGLDDPGIEYRLGPSVSAPVQSGLGAHPTSYTMGTGSFPGIKRPGRGVDHPPPSSAEVIERVQLNIHLLPLWAVVAFSRMSFTFTLVRACDLQLALAVANEWKVKRMVFRKT